MEQDEQEQLEALYREVVDLGDRARGWFDGPGLQWRATLPVDGQAAVAIESLGTTTRLLGVMAWLLDPAHGRGEQPGFSLAISEADLPAGSPLAGTPGGDVATAARRLLINVCGLAGKARGESDL